MFELVAVVDQDETRRKVASDLYNVSTHSSYLDLDLDLDLVIISTRPTSHMSLAAHFIKAGINILITKPCGLSSLEAQEMANSAEKAGTKVFCDFTYHFSPLINFLTSNPVALPVVREMREYTSYRTALGIVQADVDVLADLAVHDIYILNLIKGSLPEKVNCTKTNSSAGKQLQAAIISMVWIDGFIATIHVSWNSPKKVRLISITSSDHGILLEEMNRESPIQLVHFMPTDAEYLSLSAEEKYSRNVSYSMGNLEIPQIDMYEALSREMTLIGEALQVPESSISLPNASDAVKVWKVVEALRRSAELEGARQYV